MTGEHSLLSCRKSVVAVVVVGAAAGYLGGAQAEFGIVAVVARGSTGIVLRTGRLGTAPTATPAAVVGVTGTIVVAALGGRGWTALTGIGGA